ncbi:hypothetical protein SLEP1_g20412 [Rubroshorea leprosula]|uniref:Uncharacterized protein n=1 Tax=Rubroshorea leprosula TaxID=152421 RepID=A0AAV5J8P9_9ROSI|nr:hypothetical protein SLEP1_g20412 [Rubroshorea leprosula]
MQYLLNERGIIDVYVEHVCDEPNILDLLESGTTLHEAADEGTMDIREGCVTQNSPPAPNCSEAPKTAKGEGDEIDAVHGDDEESGEGCVTQNSQLVPNFHEALAIEGDTDETDAVHGGDLTEQQDQEKNAHDDEDLLDVVHSDVDDEEDERVPVGTDGHGDLASDSSFENNEDEFEVSNDDSSEYNVVDEDEPEEEEEDVRTTRNGDLWFNPS